MGRDVSQFLLNLCTYKRPTKSDVPELREMGLNEAAASSEEAVRRRVKSSVVVVVESERAMSSAKVSTAAIGIDRLCDKKVDATSSQRSAL